MFQLKVTLIQSFAKIEKIRFWFVESEMTYAKQTRKTIWNADSEEKYAPGPSKQTQIKRGSLGSGFDWEVQAWRMSKNWQPPKKVQV